MSLSLLTALCKKAGNSMAKHKVGAGSLVGIGMGSLFLIPEVGKVSKASKMGKTWEQIGGSAINFGKWYAVPAIIAGIVNPVGLLGCAAVGISAFIAPSLIPEIDVTEKNSKLNFNT